MAVTDWHYPADCDHVNGGVGGTWNNPENAEGESGFDDDLYAKFEWLGASPGSWLRCYNFGFLSSEIPKGSILVGIEFEAKQDGNYAVDGSIRLRTSEGQVGDDKADTINIWTDFEGPTYKVWGGAADLWSAGISRPDILASTFGIDISTKYKTDPGGEAPANIDGVRARIYYTPQEEEGVFGAVI